MFIVINIAGLCAEAFFFPQKSTKLWIKNFIFMDFLFITMPKIVEIEGIGKTYAKKLVGAGVKTTEDLLNVCATKEGRTNFAQKTGISEQLILEWVNLADLFRIKGIGEEYSDLLEEAGVDTVAELARRDPANLYAKILEINKAKKLVRRPPTPKAVESWVEQAKKLPKKVEY